MEECIKYLSPTDYKYPVDGIIFELNSKSLSESLGKTSHHECCRIALKWADDLYETTLTNIEWQTSRTGLINPVAIFDVFCQVLFPKKSVRIPFFQQGNFPAFGGH